MTTLTQQEQQTSEELLQLNGTDYVEFYVGNARQAATFIELALGFKLVAYAGPETGSAIAPLMFCSRARFALC